MATEGLRAWWQNCGGGGEEVLAIDAMEDSLGPLDEQAIEIRRLITGFEACYHEADKEAEFIAGAIGAGQCPQRANERPAPRKKELENARQILSMWCEGSVINGMDRDVGGVRADELFSFIGEPSPLKRWQVAGIVDKIGHALDPNHPYHNLALNVGDYGEPGTCAVGEHYKDDATFLRRTRETIIHDTVDGRKSKVSLAFAIDLHHAVLLGLRWIPRDNPEGDWRGSASPEAVGVLCAKYPVEPPLRPAADHFGYAWILLEEQHAGREHRPPHPSVLGNADPGQTLAGRLAGQDHTTALEPAL